jgi:hypothetical protein
MTPNYVIRMCAHFLMTSRLGSVHAVGWNKLFSLQKEKQRVLLFFAQFKKLSNVKLFNTKQKNHYTLIT